MILIARRIVNETLHTITQIGTIVNTLVLSKIADSNAEDSQVKATAGLKIV